MLLWTSCCNFSFLAARWVVFGVVLVATGGKLKFWVLPNLDNDKKGFFESFKPLHSAEWVKEKKKSKKKKEDSVVEEINPAEGDREDEGEESKAEEDEAENGKENEAGTKNGIENSGERGSGTENGSGEEEENGAQSGSGMENGTGSEPENKPPISVN